MDLILHSHKSVNVVNEVVVRALEFKCTIVSVFVGEIVDEELKLLSHADEALWVCEFEPAPSASSRHCWEVCTICGEGVHVI